MDAISKNCPNALHLAVLRCDIPKIKELLAARSDPSAVDTDGMTPLHWAVYVAFSWSRRSLDIRIGWFDNLRQTINH